MAYKVRLTKEQHAEMVHLHKNCGWSIRQLEARFGIPKSSMHRIVCKGTGYEIIATDSSK